jgi:hypothetical protein
LALLKPGYTFLVLFLRAGPILAPTGITPEPFLDLGEAAHLVSEWRRCCLGTTRFQPVTAPSKMRRWELLGGLRGRILAVGLEDEYRKRKVPLIVRESYVSASHHLKISFLSQKFMQALGVCNDALHTWDVCIHIASKDKETYLNLIFH